MCVSSCSCVFVSVMHSVAILNAVFCVICSLLMFVSGASGDHMVGLQTTHPTSGGAVTAFTNCCANCVKPSLPQQCGPDLPF